jgi:hypothetical protein
MAKLLEEMAPFFAERRAKANEHVLNQSRARAEVGRHMAELIADPRWSVYVQHLEELRNREAEKAGRLSETLTSGIIVSHETYIQQAAELMAAKRYIEAMDTAINLVSELIKSGEIATKVIAETS